MALKEKAGKILSLLRREYPRATTELKHSNALELLVATILSARCTDERVNRVTEKLFKKYRKPEDYANADREELEKEIRETGFYRNKAKSIMGAARAMVEKFNGRVPDSMEGLLELPGVARKTANVVLGTWFKKNEGIAVDTHVKRLSERLGLSKGKDPGDIEKDLMELFPRKDWAFLSHALILHGRYVCKARNPMCEKCVLSDLCPSRRPS